MSVRSFEAGYEQGLLMVNAGPNVIRFVPPLVVQKEHVDQLVEKLAQIFSEKGEGIQ